MKQHIYRELLDTVTEQTLLESAVNVTESRSEDEPTWFISQEPKNVRWILCEICLQKDCRRSYQIEE